MYYLFGGEKGKKILKQCLPAKLQSKKWRDISEQVITMTSVYSVLTSTSTLLQRKV